MEVGRIPALMHPRPPRGSRLALFPICDGNPRLSRWPPVASCEAASPQSLPEPEQIQGEPAAIPDPPEEIPERVGNLASLRTFSDVRDAVRAYYLLLTVNPIPGAYYNIGGEYSCTVGEMLDYLLSLSTVKDISVEVDEARLRPIDADLQVPDTTKFREHTGWKPEIPFEKTMHDLLDYWRDRITKGHNLLLR